MKKHLVLSSVLLGLMAWAQVAPLANAATHPADEPTTEEAADKKTIKRLEAWPVPSRDEAKVLKLELARLRKATTPDMGANGHAGVVALGQLAGPALLKALGKEKKEDARERIVGALMDITNATHTRLLAKEFGNRSEYVRMFAIERASAFPDEGIRSAAETAFKAAQKRVGTKKEVKRELYISALALTSSGSFEGLDEIHKRALKHWGKSGHAIRNAIEALRGPKATKIIAKKLIEDDRKSTVAGLRLLAGCGDPESARTIVAPFLDNKDNSIRVAAINALRGVVDGEKPLDKLPVFEAVERANKWKARL